MDDGQLQGGTQPLIGAMAGPAPDNAERKNRLWRMLEMVSKVSGFSTILYAIGRLTSIPDGIVNTVVLLAAVTFLVALLLSQRLNKWVRIGMPITYLVLVGLTVWYVMYEVNPWTSRKKSLAEAVSECGQNNDRCVGTAITNMERPKPTTDFSAEQLAIDETAGSYLMKNPVVMDTLNRRLGIKSHFIGTGFAVPVNGNGYGSARVAEYLVPNYTVGTRDDAREFKLDPKTDFLDKTIQQIISSKLTEQNDTKFLDNVNAALNDPDPERPPAVIRFQQFPPASYHGRFGQDESSKVFFLKLRDVWNLPLQRGANLSGYQLNPDPQNNTIIFLWVFIPSGHAEVVPATWSNIISNASAWIK